MNLKKSKVGSGAGKGREKCNYNLKNEKKSTIKSPVKEFLLSTVQWWGMKPQWARSEKDPKAPSKQFESRADTVISSFLKEESPTSQTPSAFLLYVIDRSSDKGCLRDKTLSIWDKMGPIWRLDIPSLVLQLSSENLPWSGQCGRALETDLFLKSIWVRGIRQTHRVL